MAAYQTLNDTQLLTLLKGEDKDAFAEIYNRYSGLLYIYAFKLFSDTDSAKDAVQELFISIWDNRNETQYNSSFAAYLYSSIRHKFLKMIAHQKVRSTHADSFLSIFNEGVQSTDAYIAEKELMREVEGLIAGLPPKMARVFTLSRIQHQTNQEIADELGISEKTVKNLLSKATTQIKPKIGLGILLFILNL